MLDALLGYSVVGGPRGVVAELVAWANASGAPILALDLPSGLDATIVRGGVRSNVVPDVCEIIVDARTVGAKEAAAALVIADLLGWVIFGE